MDTISGEVVYQDHDYTDPYNITGAQSLRPGDFIFLAATKVRKFGRDEKAEEAIIEILDNNISTETLTARTVACATKFLHNTETLSYDSFHKNCLSISRFAKDEDWKKEWKHFSTRASEYSQEYGLNPLLEPNKFILAQNLKMDSRYIFKIVGVRGDKVLVTEHGSIHKNYQDSVDGLGKFRWLDIDKFHIKSLDTSDFISIARGGILSSESMVYMELTKELINEYIMSVSSEEKSIKLKHMASDALTLTGLTVGLATAFKVATGVANFLIPPSKQEYPLHETETKILAQT